MLRARATGIFAVLFGLGCSPGAPPPSSAGPTTISVAPPQPAPTAEAAERPGPGCTFEADHVSDPLTLRIQAGSPPFATLVRGPRVRVRLPPGEASLGGHLLVSARGVELRGAIHAGELGLYPTQATLIEGFVVPLPNAKLRWTAATADRLTVRLALDPSRIESPVDVATTLACDALALNQVAFEHEHLLPPAASSEPAAFRSGRKIPLRTRPEQSPVAWLRFEPDQQRTAFVHESRAHQTRIHSEFDHFVLVGWVPTDAVDLYGDIISDAFGGGGLGLRGLPRSSQGSVCPYALELVGRVGGITRPVGSLRAGTRFDVTPATGPYREIDLGLYWFKLAGDAKLLASDAALRECEVRPTP